MFVFARPCGGAQCLHWPAGLHGHWPEIPGPRKHPPQRLQISAATWTAAATLACLARAAAEEAVNCMSVRPAQSREASLPPLEEPYAPATVYPGHPPQGRPGRRPAGTAYKVLHTKYVLPSMSVGPSLFSTGPHGYRHGLGGPRSQVPWNPPEREERLCSQLMATR